MRILLGMNFYLLGLADISYSLQPLGGNGLLDEFWLVMRVFVLSFRSLAHHNGAIIIQCNKMLHRGFCDEIFVINLALMSIFD